MSAKIKISMLRPSIAVILTLSTGKVAKRKKTAENQDTM